MTELTKGTNPTTFELALLHELCWHLQSNHTRTHEVIALFDTSIRPILAEEEFDKRYSQEFSCRLSRLEWVVNRIFETQAK